jgi:ParB-like chromosome segregation protein Spo0J
VTHARLTVRTLELAKLLPHPKNPRQHPEPGSPEWEALKASLQHDYFDPLIWNERNGFLVSGHLRTKVLASMGVTKADCVVVDYDEATHVNRMLAANRHSAIWDEGKMQALSAELSSMDLKISDLKIESLTADPPQAPASTPAEPSDAERWFRCPKCAAEFKRAALKLYEFDK